MYEKNIERDMEGLTNVQLQGLWRNVKSLAQIENIKFQNKCKDYMPFKNTWALKVSVIVPLDLENLTIKYL